jgi:two-component system, NarL family, sensor kinase
MSERTRAALGAADNLADTIESACGPLPARAALHELCFWPVWRSGVSVLLGAEPHAPGEREEDSSSLWGLHAALLGRYFRLEAAAYRLSERVRRRRRGAAGGTALRQIERERLRLGRELHTSVGQVLAAIRLQLEVVDTGLDGPPAGVRQALDRISGLLANALEQVRSISHRLHPPEWQRLRIEAALQQLWEISGIPQNFEASLEVHGLPREPDPEIKALLYRSMQEALSNLAHHSRARRVVGVLEVRDEAVVLTIADDGVGFDAAGLFSGPASVASGIGLRSIREQAESVGGALRIESGPAGTKLEISASFSVGGS